RGRGRAGVAVLVSGLTRAWTAAEPWAISWRMAYSPMRCWPPRSGVGAWTSCQGCVISAILAFISSSRTPASATGQRPAGRPGGRPAVPAWRPSAELAAGAPAEPGGAGGSTGSAKAAGVTASAHAVIASLNARLASEYCTLARTECPQVSALVVKTSPGVPAAETLATRNPGVHRAPRPANAMTDWGRPDRPTACTACTAIQSHACVTDDSTPESRNRYPPSAEGSHRDLGSAKRRSPPA